MEKQERTYKIGEAASMLEVNTSVLRFWEDEFSQLRPQRTPKGQRLYSREDMVLLGRIKTLLYERGMTLEGARKVLEGAALPRVKKEREGTEKETEAAGMQADVLRLTLCELGEVRRMLAEAKPVKAERREHEKKQLSLLNMTGGGA